MRQFTRFISRGLKYGTLLTTLGFVLVILLQIFARLLLPTAPSWTEEAARVFFILAIGCSAGLALRSGEYVYFDFFYRRLSPTGQQRLSFVSDLLTVVLFALFSGYALQFTGMGLAERSPSLRLTMAIPFGAMLLLGLSCLVFAVDRLRHHFAAQSADQ